MISKGIRTFWGHHNHELPWDSRVIGTADFKFEAKFSESINFRVFGPSHLLSWSGGSLFFCWHRFVSLSLDDARNRVGLEVTIQFESWAKLNMHENITHLFDLAQDSIWIMTPPCPTQMSNSFFAWGKWGRYHQKTPNLQTTKIESWNFVGWANWQWGTPSWGYLPSPSWSGPGWSTTGTSSRPWNSCSGLIFGSFGI